MIKAIVKNGDSELINTFCEIILNILRGNVPITKATKKKLLKYTKRVLRCVICRKRSIAKKRKIFIQKGAGLLPLIIASVLSGLAGSVADKFLGNNSK